MGKILITQILLAFILFSCKPDGLRETQQIEKKIKSYTAEMIPFRFGEPSESDKFTWEGKEYDSSGNVTLLIFRDSSYFDIMMSNLYVEEFIYENELVKEKIKESISMKSRHVYSYLNGKLFNEDVYDEDGLKEKYKYEYNENESKPFKMSYWRRIFDSDPTTHYYTYDIIGNIVKDSINYNDGVYGISYFTYDDKNNLVLESYYSSRTDMKRIQSVKPYQYNSLGQIQEVVFSPWYMDEFLKYIYTYSEDGNISKIDAYESKNGHDGHFEQKAIIKYEYSYY